MICPKYPDNEIYHRILDQLDRGPNTAFRAHLSIITVGLSPRYPLMIRNSRIQIYLFCFSLLCEKPSRLSARLKSLMLSERRGFVVISTSSFGSINNTLCKRHRCGSCTGIDIDSLVLNACIRCIERYVPGILIVSLGCGHV